MPAPESQRGFVVNLAGKPAARCRRLPQLRHIEQRRMVAAAGKADVAAVVTDMVQLRLQSRSGGEILEKMLVRAQLAAEKILRPIVGRRQQYLRRGTVGGKPLAAAGSRQGSSLSAT